LSAHLMGPAPQKVLANTIRCKGDGGEDQSPSGATTSDLKKRGRKEKRLGAEEPADAINPCQIKEEFRKDLAERGGPIKGAPRNTTNTTKLKVSDESHHNYP